MLLPKRLLMDHPLEGTANANRIPEKDLCHRLKSNYLVKGKLGQPPVPGWDAEKKIVVHLKRLKKPG